MSNGMHSLGIWGPVTASLDFCEANYQFSAYIAEMANTMSNLFGIYLAAQGMSDVWKQNLPTRYMVAFLSFALVGVGSFAFHATLLYEAQLADELPMIYSVAYGVFLLSDLGKSRRGNFILLLCVIFCVLFTWSYRIYRNPIYHEVVFAALLILNTLRGAYILRWSDTADQTPLHVKSDVNRLLWCGVGNFLFGFLIWNMDNIFCDHLTRAKTSIGWPAAFFLEGHSWWHVFTSIGSYQLWIAVTYMHVTMYNSPYSTSDFMHRSLCTKGNSRDYTLAYKSMYLPYVKRQSEVKQHQN